jgi:large subunit ribosomal protein L10
LIRSYVSLLQTTPLIIFFQHNNLKANEWVSIRRELANAMRKLDDQLASHDKPEQDRIGQFVKLEVIKTNMFEPALRITEYFKPSITGSITPSPTPVDMASIPSEKDDPNLTHALSRAAYMRTQKHRNKHALTPLLTGSLAILTLPSVSPQYLKSAFQILAPTAGATSAFPAPTRRAVPSYYEPAVQDGLKKLLLLGARIDGQVFDMEGVRWVGGIEGGIEGLRGQLVQMLQGFGGGLVQALESGGRGVWWTLEGRRKMLEDEEKDKGAEGKES